ncbi:MAG: hypothetical protein RL177_1210 [Bacteroidota bacterium]
MTWTLPLAAQSLRVGSHESRWARFQQMAGRDSSTASFTILPISEPVSGKRNGYSTLRILPVEVQATQTTGFRQGYNHGNRIPGVGLETWATAGVYFDDGRVSIQLRPEVVTSELDSFQTYPGDRNPDNDIFFWRTYFERVLNVIDAPERLGYAPVRKLLPGQSFIRFHAGPVSLGLSTEHLWWGPGIRNSLLMTNNASGFLHGSLATREPLQTPLGRIEAKMIVGKLENSGLDPRTSDTEGLSRFFYRKRADDHRVLMGSVIAWQPTWTPGLTLGMIVTDVAYSRSLQTWHDYLPLFKPHQRQPFGVVGNPYRRGLYDRRASYYARYVQPESGVEVYGEYAREEMATSAADFLEIPEHTRAYVIGAQKQLPFYFGLDVLIHAEMTQTEFTATRSFRPSPSWYTHHVIRHGYTHKGQIIGSGLGPGGSSQFLNVALLNGRQKLGFFVERQVHNNDFYYSVFNTTFQRHWVDLAGGMELMASWKSVSLFADVRAVRAYNYQYQEASIPGVRYIGVDRTSVFTSGGMRLRL